MEELVTELNKLGLKYRLTNYLYYDDMFYQLMIAGERVRCRKEDMLMLIQERSHLWLSNANRF